MNKNEFDAQLSLRPRRDELYHFDSDSCGSSRNLRAERAALDRVAAMKKKRDKRSIVSWAIGATILLALIMIAFASARGLGIV